MKLKPLLRWLSVAFVLFLASCAADRWLLSPPPDHVPGPRYLIINLTLMKLVTQRGNIDCGGAEYVLIRYGNFFEYVAPIAGGHLSVGIEPHANPLELAEMIRRVVTREVLSPPKDGRLFLSNG